MNITEIISKLKTDPAFAAKYRGLSDTAAILEQAKRDGYNVTAEDVKNVLSAYNTGTKELSVDELASVAGGKGDYNCPKCGGSPKPVDSRSSERICNDCDHSW